MLSRDETRHFAEVSKRQDSCKTKQESRKKKPKSVDHHHHDLGWCGVATATVWHKGFGVIIGQTGTLARGWP